ERVVPAVVAEVATVPEAAAGEEDRQVGVVVRRRVAEVAGVEDHGTSQEIVLAFAALLELSQELAEDADLGFLDQGQLLQLAGLLTVVRSIVMGERDVVHARLVLRAEMERNDAGRIGLQ